MLDKSGDGGYNKSRETFRVCGCPQRLHVFTSNRLEVKQGGYLFLASMISTTRIAKANISVKASNVVRTITPFRKGVATALQRFPQCHYKAK